MLSLTELRIGSWVSYEDKHFRVAEISGDGTVGIVRSNNSGIETRFVKNDFLDGIKFTKDILRCISGYIPKEREEEVNHYLVSITEDLKEDLSMIWSLSFRELEGSWWVNIEESSALFETIGEGEFYFVHNLQGILSSFINLDIEIQWNTVI
jgi:hypothetical protein